MTLRRNTLCACGCGNPTSRTNLPPTKYLKNHNVTNLGRQKSTTPKATVKVTMRDIFWAAGFIEGEGHFRWRHSEVVAVGQVQKEPLERLARLFGGKIASYKRQLRKYSDYHEWRIHGSRARGLMFTLYPLLSSRRKAQVIAAFHRNVRCHNEAFVPISREPFRLPAHTDGGGDA